MNQPKVNKLELFREIYKNHTAMKSWIECVPTEIRMAFYDNPLTELMRCQFDLLLEAVFTKEELNDIHWFLYDWYNHKELSWKIDDKKYQFNDIEDYIKMLVEIERWKD